MANPYKRGKSWAFVYYSYYYEDGKRKRKQHKKGGYVTREEAEKDLRVYKLKSELGELKDYSKETLASFLEHWFESHKKTLQPNTVNGYANNIKHIVAHIGDVKLKNLKAADIQKLYNILLNETGLSAKSVVYVNNVLKTALKSAVNERLIENNVCLQVKPPKIEKYRPTLLSQEQLHTLFEGLSGNPYSIEIKLSALLGLRRGEILGLKNTDIDYSRHTITIQRQVSIVRDRTAKENKSYYGLKCLKSESSYRVLYISPDIEQMIKQRQLINAKHKNDYKELYVDNGLIFCNELGEIESPQTLYHAFKRALVNCGLPDIRFHDLRHSYAVLCIDLGVPMKAISQSLGHSSTAITDLVYADSIRAKQQLSDMVSKAINGN